MHTTITLNLLNLEKFLLRFCVLYVKAMFRVLFQLKADGAFQIFADDYVTDDSGTGVVHSAPAFGEVSPYINQALLYG